MATKATKNPTVDARKALKAGQSMLARVKRVGNKLVIQPVSRVAKRAVKRIRRMANGKSRTLAGGVTARRITPALFNRYGRPLLRAPYNTMTWAAYSRDMPEVKTMLFEGGKMIGVADSKGRRIR